MTLRPRNACSAIDPVAGAGITSGLCVGFRPAAQAIPTSNQITAHYFITALLLSSDGSIVQEFPRQIANSCNNAGGLLGINYCEFVYIGLPDQGRNGPRYKLSVTPQECRDGYVPFTVYTSNSVPVIREGFGNQCNYANFIPPPPPPPSNPFIPPPPPPPSTGPVPRGAPTSPTQRPTGSPLIPMPRSCIELPSTDNQQRTFNTLTRGNFDGGKSADGGTNRKSKMTYESAECVQPVCCDRCWKASRSCCSLPGPPQKIVALSVNDGINISWQVEATFSYSNLAPMSDAPYSDGAPIDDSEGDLAPKEDNLDESSLTEFEVLTDEDPAFLFDDRAFIVSAYNIDRNELDDDMDFQSFTPAFSTIVYSNIYSTLVQEQTTTLSADMAKINISAKTTLSYELKNLNDGGTYVFTVTALTCGGVGPTSELSNSIIAEQNESFFSSGNTIDESVYKQLSLYEENYPLFFYSDPAPVSNVRVQHLVTDPASDSLCVRWEPSDVSEAGQALSTENFVVYVIEMPMSPFGNEFGYNFTMVKSAMPSVLDNALSITYNSALSAPSPESDVDVDDAQMENKNTFAIFAVQAVDDATGAISIPTFALSESEAVNRC